jgi:hypothetical protein
MEGYSSSDEDNLVLSKFVRNTYKDDEDEDDNMTLQEIKQQCLSDPNNNNLKSVADKDTDDDNLPQKNVSYLSSENKTSNVEKEKKMEKVLQTKMETIKQTKVEMFMWIQIKTSVRTIVETFMKKHMEKSILNMTMMI